jgi:hypothetical protein
LDLDYAASPGTLDRRDRDQSSKDGSRMACYTRIELISQSQNNVSLPTFQQKNLDAARRGPQQPDG